MLSTGMCHVFVLSMDNSAAVPFIPVIFQVLNKDFHTSKQY